MKLKYQSKIEIALNQLPPADRKMVLQRLDILDQLRREDEARLESLKAMLKNIMPMLSRIENEARELGPDATGVIATIADLAETALDEIDSEIGERADESEDGS